MFTYITKYLTISRMFRKERGTFRTIAIYDERIREETSSYIYILQKNKFHLSQLVKSL